MGTNKHDIMENLFLRLTQTLSSDSDSMELEVKNKSLQTDKDPDDELYLTPGTRFNSTQLLLILK